MIVAVAVIAGLPRRSVDRIVAADDIGAVGVTGCALAFIVTDLASNWIGVTIAADGIGTIAVAGYALAAGIALLGSAIGIPGITITAAWHSRHEFKQLSLLLSFASSHSSVPPGITFDSE